GGDDPGIGLRPVEIGHQPLELAAKLAGHGMPELDLGFGPCARWRQRHQHPGEPSRKHGTASGAGGSPIASDRATPGLKSQIHSKFQFRPVKRLPGVLQSFNISSNECTLYRSRAQSCPTFVKCVMGAPLLDHIREAKYPADTSSA